MPDLERRLREAERIAREAGALALGYFRDREALTVERKGHQDWVSAADREVEALIRRRFAALCAGDAVLGEEAGLDGAAAGEMAAEGGLWVVDPIDGTAGFLGGLPSWCVSLAYVEAGALQLGVVYDPNADELFAARRGGGARLNGRPLRASQARSLTEGSVGVGLSSRTSSEPPLRFIAGLLAEGGLYFRNGSGALMLAYVAAGRLLGYYEAHINAWDCLGALAVLGEAGAWTNDFLAGDGLWRGNTVLAAAPGVRDALVGLAATAGTPVRG